ncbi:MAG TPA: helix-turn-helix domain-containing protein [Novosphingobium sp.]|nr:helix-turn-helix domain-containing protein [Novosphingobium sp.]HZV08690.1 helix-turn-helix domain-containing protein [Novosphingobium sp.]
MASLSPAAPWPAAQEEPRERAWRFSSDEYAPAQRRKAWARTMERLRLPQGVVAEGADFHASVICRTTPMGMELALLSGSAQEIAGRNPHQPAAIWLTLLLEGTAELDDGDGLRPMRPGDIAYGPTGVDAALRLSSAFRLLFISIPQVALTHRIVAARQLGIGLVAGDEGLGAIYSALLRAVAGGLDALGSDQLRPIEVALAEFLVAYLADRASPALDIGRSRAKAQLHRIRQAIEALLGEPELTLAQVAEESGVSPRYLQKLFAAEGLNFTFYLRLRRLERCRLELASPIYAGLSISQISFNWGFNGSSHFSRAFRAQYGLSPRAYRKQALGR